MMLVVAVAVMMAAVVLAAAAAVAAVAVVVAVAAVAAVVAVAVAAPYRGLRDWMRRCGVGAAHFSILCRRRYVSVAE
jgi:hypothetical protein